MRFIVFLSLISCTFTYGQLEFPPTTVIKLHQKPEGYNGVVIEKYSNGKPKLWRQEKDGKAEGLWMEWYPNGRLRYRAHWQNGLGNGKWEYFYSNGQLRSVSFYIDDIAQGMYLSYHENGELAEESAYKNGQLDGIVTKYDVNGIPLSRKRYQNGIQIIDQPVLYQPGIIATESANEWGITFTPNANTAYFTRRLTDGTPQKIYRTTKNAEGNWSQPQVAAFSDNRDEACFISPDGQYLFFASTRPINSGQATTTLDMNIWMMTKTEAGWSKPKPLSDTINKQGMEDDEWPQNYETGPSVDEKGNLYYWTRSSTENVSNLYKARIQKNGSFGKPEELLPPSHNQGFDSSPAVSPDGKLLFFVSSNRSESYGREDLYFSRLVKGIWSEPKNLGPVINSNYNEGMPSFSPDGKYFFFSSDRAENFDSNGERIWSIYYMETQFLNLD